MTKEMIAVKTALSLSVLPLAGYTAQAEGERVAKRPNVIFVLSDDQGYGDFGCYGNPYVDTPNMDRLYRESTRLTDFYTCPVCSPTRASLLTGRYNYRTSVWDTWHGGCSMNTDEFTLAEAMKQAGYKTALFGKWHLGYNYPMRPQDQGFDEVLIWDMFHKEKENRKNPVMIHNESYVQMQGFEGDIVFDCAIDYLRKNKDSQEPFFMYVASALPHTWLDYQIPPECLEKYKKYPEVSAFNAEILAMVDRLDENLGRLLKSIDELGLAEDTIVIFTSDNGPEFDPKQSRFNVNLRGQKGTTYEGGIKLPLFVRWPGVLPAGRDIKQVGAAIDFMPTVLDMCGIKTDLPNPVDGISLWPQISGASGELVPRTFCGQFHRADAPTPWENSYIRDGDYKLVNGSELFNLEKDLVEQNDLSKQLPGKVAELREKYAQWFKDVISRSTENGEFKIHPAIVGSDRQLRTNLQYSDEHPVHGWPMQVIDPGPYRVTVTLMQNDLFDETSVCWLQFGEKTLKKNILPNDGNLVFDNVIIPVGEYDLKIGFEGTFRVRKFRFAADVGHRNIYIERMEKEPGREGEE